MAHPAAPPLLVPAADRHVLQTIVRAGTSEQRAVTRARIVLRSAEGGLVQRRRLGGRDLARQEWVARCPPTRPPERIKAEQALVDEPDAQSADRAQIGLTVFAERDRS